MLNVLTRSTRTLLTAIACFCALSTTNAFAETPAATARLPETVHFNTDIRPIFAKNCIGCHGGPKQASGVSFIYRESALAPAESGERPIVPGKPAASPLIARISSTDDDFRMPPADHGPPLSPQQIALFKKWIEQGAQWEEHWAFIPPKPQPLPTVEQATWCRQDFDRFILAKIETAKLHPSKEASRAEWLRRVSFDLIGLPPSPQEIAEFAADDSPTAYEKVVDRLLQSPQFGERWSSMWLDLARYADTVGFERDPNRSIWPYRDWLIRAFNADMPFDEFTVKQLAGDLLPNPSLDDRIATAFHRNTQTNTEGGTDDEEFRLAAVLDRTNTTWQVWSALTFGCTQCHSHPYDPLRHDEYYKFTAFFNTSQDADLGEDLPTVSVPAKTADFGAANDLDNQIASLRNTLRDQTLPIIETKSAWKNVAFDKVRSTGHTKLKTRLAPGADATEVIATGTISAYSRYTLEAPLPASVGTLRAIKLDALPKDLEAALKIPESGFVLSKFTAELEIPGQSKPTAIEFATVFSDDPKPLVDPEESLNDNWQGFASFSRIDRPHWAVFIPKHPVEVPLRSRLRLVIHHGRADSGEGPLVVERARVWVSDDPKWTAATDGPHFQQSLDELGSLRTKRAAIAGTGLPVMQEQAPNERRTTYVFERGNWQAKGAVVHPDVPAVFPRLSKNDPNAGAPADRLAMARWLVSGQHPLTARVLVNRLWAQLFGVGIVPTTGDFGASGAAPSHPELLDYLALRFQNEQGWQIKKLLRELVLSATYRQSSRLTPELAAVDPTNRLLPRGPRQRLAAEMIRDHALTVSGLLSDRMYGPPVMPQQPDGIWQTVYNGNVWKTSPGKDRYRRAVYTFCKRTSGYPSMLTFDAPARDVCTVQRSPTNTPLQALVTLNDPAFLECADALAKRMTTEGGTSLADQITWAYRLATSSEITPPTLKQLSSLYDDATHNYKKNHNGAPDQPNAAQHYALKIVAHTILNLDAALTR